MGKQNRRDRRALRLAVLAIGVRRADASCSMQCLPKCLAANQTEPGQSQAPNTTLPDGCGFRCCSFWKHFNARKEASCNWKKCKALSLQGKCGPPACGGNCCNFFSPVRSFSTEPSDWLFDGQVPQPLVEWNAEALSTEPITKYPVAAVTCPRVGGVEQRPCRLPAPTLRNASDTRPPLFIYNPSSLDDADTSFRLSPYSYCSTSAEHNYTSSWTEDRAPSVKLRDQYLVAWLRDNKLRALIGSGAEDSRLLKLNGLVHAIVIRKTDEDMNNPLQAAQFTSIWLVKLEPRYSEVRLTYDAMRPSERNWIPLVVNGSKLFVIYSLCPCIILQCNPKTGRCTKVYETYHKYTCKNDLRGGSTLAMVDGKLLGVAHRTLKVVRTELTTGFPLERYYEHYWFTMKPSPPYNIRGVSRLFRFPPYFNNQLDAVQFCSGLRIAADDPRYLVMEYGVADCQALTVRVPVRKVLDGFVHQRP